MDRMYRQREQRVWIRMKKRKRLRILSAGLSLSMLLTGCVPLSITPLAFTGVGRVEAASQESGDNADRSKDTVITGFGSLPDEVREQTVPLGTTIEELNLPDTLEAYMAGGDAENEGGGVKPPEDSEDDRDGQDQTPGEGDGNTGGDNNDGEKDDGKDDNSNDDGNSGTGESSNDDGTGESSNDSEGNPGSDIPGGDDTSDSGNSGDSEEETSGSAETFGGSESSDGAGGADDESPAVEKNGETRSTDGGTGTDAPETSDSADNRTTAGFSIETGSYVCTVYASENPQGGLTAGTLTVDGNDTGKEAALAEGTGAAEQTGTQPQTGTGGTDAQADTREKTVVIGNVTWQSDPAYDGSVEEVYTFTAVLPDGYALSEGVSLPQITVTVGDSIDAVIQALLERIAALPDAQEYLEKEPDIDSWEGDEDDYEEAYAEWMEGLQDYAKEALAILEEVESLTQEQQALIPQEAFDKLAAWAEIAETLSEDTMVMAEDEHQTEHHYCNGIDFEVWEEQRGHWAGEPNHSGWVPEWVFIDDKLPGCSRGSSNYFLKVPVSVSASSYQASVGDRWESYVGTLNLCLNGQTATSTSSSSMYLVRNNSTLNLYDCKNSGALRQNGNNAVIMVWSEGGKVNVYGGTITGGTAGILTNLNLSDTYVLINGGTINSVIGVNVKSGTAEISGGSITGSQYAVEASDGGQIKITGNATLNGSIHIANTNPVISEVSNLTKTYRIVYDNVADGSIVVQGSTDTTHYKLENEGFQLAAKNGNLIAASRHSVTYHENGGTITDKDKYTSYLYSAGLTLPTPTRTGYTFGGWYGNADFTGNKVTSISDTDTGNKEYYAKWTATTYTISYTLNSGTLPSGQSNPTSYTVESNSFTLNNPTKTGYTFAGWSGTGLTGSNNTSVTIAKGSMENRSYTANWTANTYTVTYNGNGKTGGNTDNSSHTYDTAKALTANGYTRSYTVTFNHNYTGSSNTEKTADYRFAGWNTQADGKGTSYTDSQSVKNLAVKNGATVTLYAKWTSQSVTYTPTRTGYTFAGWYTGSDCSGSRVDSNGTYTPTENKTLYAKWTAKTYIISYKGLENAALTTKPTEHTYGTGTAVGNPTKTGYTFAGWKINNGSAVTKDLSLSATGYTAAITLTATWTANQYRVTFHYQGATGDNGTTEKSVTYNETYGALPAPVRTGYAFKGWFTLANGEGSQVEDTTPVKITAAQTLYAYWVDAVLPDKPVLQSGVTLPGGWTNTQKTIPLTLSDNVGVKELWVSIDGGDYTKVSDFPGDSQTVTYSYTVSKEGDHTYRFKAEDAAENVSPDSEEFRVMLDTIAPVIETLTGENVTSDSVDVTFTPSEGGKAYWIVDPEETPADAQAVISDAQDDSRKGGVKAVTGGTSADIAVTDLTPGAVHKVYVVLEDAAGNLSAVKDAVFGTRPEAPVIKLDALEKDYGKEKIRVPERFGKVEVYTDPDKLPGSIVPPGEGGYLPVEPGTSIYIRYPEKPGDDVTVPASDGVKIDIPDRPAAPPAKEVAVTDTTVTVIAPSAKEEYILVEKGSLPEGAEPDWKDADKVNEKGEFTGLDPNKEYDLYVRKKATEEDFASESAKTPVRTYVTINEPQITGEGKGKEGNTAPKPAKPDEGGATVTYTGTYEEEYTPVILVDGKEIIPGAGTPGAEGSEMNWDEEAGKGEWKYVYPIPGGVPETGITVKFRERSATGITVNPERLNIHADDAANRDAIQAGNVTPLTAYLKETCSVKAAYDNRTTGAVPADDLSYAMTGTDSLAPKGGSYRCTVSAYEKSREISLTVAPVDAAVIAPAGLLKTQKTGGYTQEEVGAWLPAQVTVSYTGTGYTAWKEDRDVTWDTAPIGSGFGAQTGKETLGGTVDLPAWATGECTVSMEIEFVDRNVLNDSQMRLTQRGFTYGEKKLPNPAGSVTVRDTNPSYSYLYSVDGGITWVPAESLTVSTGGYAVPGEYRVKMTYRGDRYTGVKEVSFAVAKKKLKISKGTLEAESRNYDGTTDARLKEGGEAALSGMAEGDDVALGGTLEAHFREKGPKRNIPVNVTGFRLQGADAGCYEPAGTTLTLYATINKEDGTPPPGGGSGGSGSSGGGSNNDGSGDNSGSNNNGSNNNSGINNSGGSTTSGDKTGGTTAGDKTDGTKPGGKDDGTKPGDKTDGKNPGGSNGGSNDGTKPGDKTDGTKPGGADGGKGGSGTKPGGTDGSEGNSSGTKPGDGSNSGEGETKIVSAVIEDGKIVIDSGKAGSSGNGGGNNTGDSGNDGNGQEGENNGTGAKIATGNVPGMAGAGSGRQDGSGAADPYAASTMLHVGEGAVIVKVVCEEPELTAGVADTVAVANAVLTTEQIQLAGGGDTIEIRVEVKDITESVSGQNQKVIESAVTRLDEEQEGITLGLYVDISMFVRVGGGEWETVSTSDGVIEVVIGIPEEMRSDGRQYYVIRSHEGECDLLTDMDDAQDTITISTDKFSTYAIAYRQTDGAGTEDGAKCGLCHICPTFFGICYFIWPAVIAAAVLIIAIVVLRRKKSDEPEGRR